MVGNNCLSQNLRLDSSLWTICRHTASVTNVCQDLFVSSFILKSSSLVFSTSCFLQTLFVSCWFILFISLVTACSRPVVLFTSCIYQNKVYFPTSLAGYVLDNASRPASTPNSLFSFLTLHPRFLSSPPLCPTPPNIVHDYLLPGFRIFLFPSLASSVSLHFLSPRLFPPVSNHDLPRRPIPSSRSSLCASSLPFLASSSSHVRRKERRAAIEATGVHPTRRLCLSAVVLKRRRMNTERAQHHLSSVLVIASCCRILRSPSDEPRP